MTGPEMNMESVINETARQLAHINDTTAAQSLRKALKRLAGKSVAAPDPIFWPAGMLMLGLVEAGKVEVTCLDAWISAGARVMHTDDALAGYVLVRLYELTGERKYLDAAEKTCAFLLSAPKDEERSIIYHPEIGENNRIIYADGAGMTALFLAACGRITQETEATELAQAQIENFLRHAMDEKTGLPYHAYDLASGEKLGIVGWGRAVGWLMMGMSELKNGDRGDSSAVTSSWNRLAQDVLSYLRADGSFAWQLPAMEGHADTSATAMIGWAMLNAGEDHDASIRDYLLSQTHDGVVTGALGECIDYGQYPQQYGVYPWGQGAALAYLAASLR